MFAKNLELLLNLLCETSDVSYSLPIEFAERFEALRRYSKLPRGREKRDQELTIGEIVAAIFGVVPNNPKWAGHAAIVLANLRPVGGVGVSFFGASTLQEAIEHILADAAARQTLARLEASLSARGVNSHGYAVLSFEIAGATRSAFYVPREAVSLLKPGAEKDFDPKHLHLPVTRGVAFSRQFFERVAQEIQIAKAFPTPPAGDGSEYDAEEARRERYQKLGVRPNSKFLHVGVDNHVTWPNQETIVKFDKYHLVLLPQTGDHIQSIHVDLTANQLTPREAKTIINRFLSIAAWCDDQYAIAQDGGFGNPVPVPVPKRSLVFATAHHWIFDRKIPSSEEARLALALYREARNAQQNFMISYAVLNFFKIIEIKNKDAKRVKQWLCEHIEALRRDTRYRNSFDTFFEACANEKPEEYIYKACRVAVAHARDKSKSDPDDAGEVRRLYVAGEVLHAFARHFISTEFRISEVIYSGE